MPPASASSSRLLSPPAAVACSSARRLQISQVLVMELLGVILSLPNLFILMGQQLLQLQVLSGINAGSNCGHNIVCSGTVAGAREAFMCGVPSIALSYGWVPKKSSIHDLKLAVESCLPIINSVLNEIRNKAFPLQFFLNIAVPTDVSNHKGFKLTKQGKSNIKIFWTQTSSGVSVDGDATANMYTQDTTGTTKISCSSPTQEQLWSKKIVRNSENKSEKEEEGDDIDWQALQEGYIAVTPLSALSCSEIDTVPYFRGWLPRVTDNSCSSSL
ncbi:5'-nucleotidase SurE-like isoform X3 [Dioscorea cayenensis subsp. rotundata]|uniref:5'-nucleotidase SurE-like isoform X3 n=1 Tax=Dioscorea cayennensis subsp. rotundata TaxID=55577 RepID=A0AB40CJF5_DIOCR|nr:5'-nucleotidase SurE-like isoform X3 [Dioscorea cayenensis subsp. rotundata]